MLLLFNDDILQKQPDFHTSVLRVNLPKFGNYAFLTLKFENLKRLLENV
jgi:hypothetical protein